MSKRPDNAKVLILRSGFHAFIALGLGGILIGLLSIFVAVRALVTGANVESSLSFLWAGPILLAIGWSVPLLTRVRADDRGVRWGMFGEVRVDWQDVISIERQWIFIVFKRRGRRVTRLNTKMFRTEDIVRLEEFARANIGASS